MQPRQDFDSRSFGAQCGEALSRFVPGACLVSYMVVKTLLIPPFFATSALGKLVGFDRWPPRLQYVGFVALLIVFFLVWITVVPQ
jgi:hypothetical protein